MIVGQQETLAIEFGIAEAYEERGLLALGFYLIHVCGISYGIRYERRTFLGCSYNELNDRISMRGKHVAPFSAADAKTIAAGFRKAEYDPDGLGCSYFNMDRASFLHQFNRNKLIWAPDGESAFDDGSIVIQFDIQDKVRIIGCKADGAYGNDSRTLTDLSLPHHEFYDLLQEAVGSFDLLWKSTEKATELPVTLLKAKK